MNSRILIRISNKGKSHESICITVTEKNWIRNRKSQNRIHIEVKREIQMRISVMRIRNTGVKAHSDLLGLKKAVFKEKNNYVSRDLHSIVSALI